MTCPHETDVGAYVLDVLEPGERERVAAHLAACPACAAALEDLRGLPELLASVPPPGAPESVPVPSELAYRRLHRSAIPAPGTSRRRPRRARRWLLAVAACAVLAAGAAAGVVLTSHSGLPAVVTASSGAVHAQARIAPAGSGSSITLTLGGVESGERCELVAFGSGGRRATASVWTATYEGTAQVTGTVPIAPADLSRLVVSTPDGRPLVTLRG